MTWKPITNTETGSYTLPVASSTILGGVKVGNNLSISNGILSAVAGSGTTEHYRGLLSDYTATSGVFGNDAYIKTTLESGMYRVLNSNLPPVMKPPFSGVDFILIHQKMFTDFNWAYQWVYPVDNPGKLYTRRVLCGSPHTDGRQGAWMYVGENAQISVATNKKLLSMGDSITAKWGGSVDYPTTPPSQFLSNPDGYQPHIIKRLGIPVYSIGYGGAKMARVLNHEPWDSHSFHKLATTFTDFASYTHVTVAYGTNDAGWNLPLGGVNSTDIYTVQGSMNVGIDAIYAANANVQLFFITPPLRTDHAGGVTTDQGDYDRIKTYSDAIIEVCNKYDIPYFYSLKQNGINLRNYATTLEGDKLHPGTAGHNLAGPRIAEWLKQYI
jgi:lysophospholipase L1-like esterase